MAVLVTAIHVVKMLRHYIDYEDVSAWMAGTRPAMTRRNA
jgi:hypothetical protein